MRPHHTDVQPLERPVRLLLLLLAAGLTGLLVLARWLEPDPRGFGTHMQLGLGPCVFAMQTGFPCPTCGMTTSFAWFTRGEMGQSWQANPAGCLIAGVTVPLAAWLVLCSQYKKPVGFRSLEQPLMGLLVCLVVLSLTFWMIRIIGVHLGLGLTGPPPVFNSR